MSKVVATKVPPFYIETVILYVTTNLPEWAGQRQGRGRRRRSPRTTFFRRLRSRSRSSAITSRCKAAFGPAARPPTRRSSSAASFASSKPCMTFRRQSRLGSRCRRWLRKASGHIGGRGPTRTSPRKKAKASSSTALVLFDDEEDCESDALFERREDETTDDVSVEVQKWKFISPETLSAFKDKDTSMINEFAFMWAKRKEFPLHYFVFRQTASHLPHEGNVEQIFSLGGRLSDPNMNPAYLATLVFIGSNLKVYMPPMKDIFQRYLCKFSKNGKLLEQDLGLTTAAPVSGAASSSTAPNE